ncbi:copper resistance protein B precursor [Desulfuromonas soudanensis]|uniref:Copper resistance protein B n=1 Tax=Desulfuromonas soudanensis TaxID=1603606 RepID=A0A0M5IYX0_9BACT|nr:copper resistance protein B [Desulfuromonas soudanensis]ALC16294.1 copper resistance protein B precursor [Desulfuromonas soudanensis]
MKRQIFFWMLTLLPALVFAADESPGDSRKGYFPADYREIQTDPQVGEGIQKYAEDGQEGPQQNFGVQPIHDNQIFATFKADRSEYQWREDNKEIFLWDVQGWIGEDYNKLYLKSEGEVLLNDSTRVEEAEIELLYSRNISKFWDVQAGLRHDFAPHPARTFAALGMQGLAPYWFEIDATAYLSEDGDLSAKFEAEYELLLTQRLVLIPRMEAGLSLQDVPEYQQWQGVTDLTLGARLLYHFRREFAPYLGVTWNRKVGKTAHNVKKDGGDIDDSGVVAGLRFWF